MCVLGGAMAFSQVRPFLDSFIMADTSLRNIAMARRPKFAVRASSSLRAINLTLTRLSEKTID